MCNQPTVNAARQFLPGCLCKIVSNKSLLLRVRKVYVKSVSLHLTSLSDQHACVKIRVSYFDVLLESVIVYSPFNVFEVMKKTFPYQM